MAAVTATTVKQAGAAHQRHPNVLAWLVFAPLLAWLVAFVVVPTIVLVLLSFGEQKGLGTFHFTMTFDIPRPLLPERLPGRGISC